MGLRAAPRSLVATGGISVDFFSSGYLDISVPRVRFRTLWIQVRIPPESGGFPHSEIPGSKPVSRLPEAYRKLQRPSSPLAAKASTECTSMLDHIIQRISRPAACSNGRPRQTLATHFAGATHYPLRQKAGIRTSHQDAYMPPAREGERLPALLLH